MPFPDSDDEHFCISIIYLSDLLKNCLLKSSARTMTFVVVVVIMSLLNNLDTVSGMIYKYVFPISIVHFHFLSPFWGVGHNQLWSGLTPPSSVLRKNSWQYSVYNMGFWGLNTDWPLRRQESYLMNYCSCLSFSFSLPFPPPLIFLTSLPLCFFFNYFFFCCWNIFNLNSPNSFFFISLSLGGIVPTK